MRRDDYQQFVLDESGISQAGLRMQDKLKAIELPDVRGLDVLDIGCDMGFWSFLCVNNGASHVVGLDRNRSVKGVHTDLIALNSEVRDKYKYPCSFYPINIGEQWRTYGRFDLVLLFSLYHHIYAQVEEHAPIWLWLWLQTKGELLWENPVDDLDSVVQLNVPLKVRDGYTKENILGAATRYFNMEYVGPALHEQHREVYRFTPKSLDKKTWECERVSGAGGAAFAWMYNHNARLNEFEHITGHRVIPGSINLILKEPFDWGNGYFRAKMKDVVQRGNGLDGDWVDRWVRIYPCFANDLLAYVFRFEGERYPTNFVEIVSPHTIDGDVTLEAFV